MTSVRTNSSNCSPTRPIIALVLSQVHFRTLPPQVTTARHISHQSHHILPARPSSHSHLLQEIKILRIVSTKLTVMRLQRLFGPVLSRTSRFKCQSKIPALLWKSPMKSNLIPQTKMFRTKTTSITKNSLMLK